MKKILITAAILLTGSCASKKTFLTESRHETFRTEIKSDSAHTGRTVKEIKQQAVKADTATAKIAVSSIKNLPAEAGFTAKSGRAGVWLRKTAGDTVVITAICDSLQNLVYYYENELFDYTKQTENYANDLQIIKTEKTKKTYSPFLAFFLGVSAGGLIVLVFAKQKSILDFVLNIIKKLFK